MNFAPLLPAVVGVAAGATVVAVLFDEELDLLELPHAAAINENAATAATTPLPLRVMSSPFGS